MFNLFDLDKDGFLKKKEFQDGLGKLFAQTFEENLKLVFELFDFDSNGRVSKEDIRTLLSHVPLAQLLELSAPGTLQEGQYTRRGGGT
jgi:Ca2+-binding EF-hand superfamily protein